MRLNNLGHPAGVEHFCKNPMCPGRAGMFSHYDTQYSHMAAEGIEPSGELVPFRRFQKSKPPHRA
jgi:hypothetical protein